MKGNETLITRIFNKIAWQHETPGEKETSCWSTKETKDKNSTLSDLLLSDITYSSNNHDGSSFFALSTGAATAGAMVVGGGAGSAE